MLDDLLLHPTCKRHLRAYISDPPHAILLHSVANSGKVAIADAMAHEIKASRPNSTIIYIKPLPDKKTVSIDQIKQLKTILRTKNSAYRVIVIPDADMLTIEAQNSFLKLLEEPSLGVIFILTSSLPNALLSTIRSRLLKIRIFAPTKKQLREYARQFVDDEVVESRLLIANGRVPVLRALVEPDVASNILQYIDQAKDILSESVESRLLRVDTLCKDVPQLYATIDALLSTCTAAMRHAITNAKPHDSWYKRVTAIETAYNQLAKNVLPKLVLTRLFLVL